MAWLPQPGLLRSKVRFDRRISVNDGAGNIRAAFEPMIASRRALLRMTSGGEMVIGDRLAGNSVFDLWLRADHRTLTVRPDDRVVDITSADPAKHRIFDIKFSETKDEMGFWLLMQIQAVAGEDGRHG